MADQVLDERVKTQMLHDFREIEAQAGGRRYAQYFTIAQALCERTGVATIDKTQVQTLRNEFMGEK